MAVNNEFLELTEKIFSETNIALAENFTERVRQLGDSTCKAGITAAVKYLSGKSELLKEELENLSVGKVPQDYEQKQFEKHIAQLNEKLNENEMDLCREAFVSGISAALAYLVKVAHFKGVDLLSTIHSDIR